jgi:hypothetical protein
MNRSLSDENLLEGDYLGARNDDHQLEFNDSLANMLDFNSIPEGREAFFLHACPLLRGTTLRMQALMCAFFQLFNRRSGCTSADLERTHQVREFNSRVQR